MTNDGTVNFWDACMALHACVVGAHMMYKEQKFHDCQRAIEGAFLAEMLVRDLLGDLPLRMQDRWFPELDKMRDNIHMLDDRLRVRVARAVLG